MKIEIKENDKIDKIEIVDKKIVEFDKNNNRFDKYIKCIEITTYFKYIHQFINKFNKFNFHYYLLNNNEIFEIDIDDDVDVENVIEIIKGMI